VTEGAGAILGQVASPPPVLTAGAIAASALLNAGAADRPWSVAAMTGVRASGPDLLHLSLTPETGLEVARELGNGLEAFGQGWIDSSRDVTAVGGLRWRF
jgi:hypothetical protein